MLDGNKSHVEVVAICTVLLYIKYLITTLVGASKKFASGNRAPEDSPATKQDFGLHAEDADVGMAALADARWQRIVANDLENIPLGLLLAWAAVITGGDSKRTTVATLVFTAARFLHTAAYILALSKPRSFFYLIGVVSVLVLAENVIAGAYN
ncbi:hypothetical protein ACHHYP_06116 [Achlya hypogyna]|uniref:Microsomal glutathione S-transferase 1 n=1 Tax=Achlya hypogyna TaxID=1202772 RepID=A0A1V9YVP9_ACHHY|nr:hypothetical protein ACHHYP_06116 [Achlya hypogyna]